MLETVKIVFQSVSAFLEIRSRLLRLDFALIFCLCHFLKPHKTSTCQTLFVDNMLNVFVKTKLCCCKVQVKRKMAILLSLHIPLSFETMPSSFLFFYR